LVNTAELKAQLEAQGQLQDIRTVFNLQAFVRMLAKIAHSFLAGELGLDGFNPELPQLKPVGRGGADRALRRLRIGLPTSARDRHFA
jgi:hypothetical protein